MKKHLILIFSLIFIITFLVSPSVTYTESTGGCSDDPYANCAQARKTHFGEFFGGVKYLKESFKQGSFSWSEEVVQSAPMTQEGYYEDDNQYFKPLFAIAGAGLTSIIVTAMIYFNNAKQKSKQRK